MNKIKLLSQNVINQIAAGEVIERPASIVKELVENSIDAGANIITLEISNGGKDLIRVTDNGIGMSREDAKLCFVKHATSKIENESDLYHLQTLGFRGEAIASVASVSLVELKTKFKGANLGTEINIEGGDEKKISDIGFNEGTQFSVKSLFFNTPARRKFLKSDSTEYSHIADSMTNFALCYPEIEFKFFNNSKKVFDLPKVSGLEKRIFDLLGDNYAKKLIPVFSDHKEIKIRGFLGDLESARTTKSGQYLFINGRQINNAYISHAVSSGYSSFLPEKMYPCFVMKMEVDPQIADFNIHPRKLEVRFSKQQDVYSITKYAVKEALEKGLSNNFNLKQNTSVTKDNQIWELKDEQNTNNDKHLFRNNFYTPSGHKNMGLRLSDKNIQESLEFSKNFSQEMSKINFEIHEERRISSIKPLTQVKNSYLICENDQGVIIIDQHAAHERIIFMKLKKNLLGKNVSKQQLLLPLQLNLSYKEVEALSANKPLLEKIGFELEFFGGNTFNVLSIPSFFNHDDVEFILKGMIDDLINEVPVKGIEDKEDYILHYIACRSAIKFGKFLNQREQEALITQLEEAEMKFTCPHGRPTMLKFSFEELEKKFGRR